MRVFLVRHGQTEDNRNGCYLGQRDPPLNERGQREAQALAAFFAGFGAAAVYTSDLRRAAATAAAIAPGATASPDTAAVSTPAFREMDLGALDGTPVASAETAHPEFLAAWRAAPAAARPPGGETLAEVQTRAWAALRDVAERHPAARVIVVSHTFVILSLVCAVLDLPLDRFRRLFVETGSVTVVDVSPAGASLWALGVRPAGHWRDLGRACG